MLLINLFSLLLFLLQLLFEMCCWHQIKMAKIQKTKQKTQLLSFQIFPFYSVFKYVNFCFNKLDFLFYFPDSTVADCYKWSEILNVILIGWPLIIRYKICSGDTSECRWQLLHLWVTFSSNYLLLLWKSFWSGSASVFQILRQTGVNSDQSGFVLRVHEKGF